VSISLGVELPDTDMDALLITHADFPGEWSYTIPL
jgi:hypothetical protein